MYNSIETIVPVFEQKQAQIYATLIEFHCRLKSNSILCSNSLSI